MEHVETLSVLQEIANLAHEGLLLYNLKENRVSYANRAASELTGLMENASPKEVFSLLSKLTQPEREHLRSEELVDLAAARDQHLVRDQRGVGL